MLPDLDVLAFKSNVRQQWPQTISVHVSDGPNISILTHGMRLIEAASHLQRKLYTFMYGSKDDGH